MSGANPIVMMTSSKAPGAGARAPHITQQVKAVLIPRNELQELCAPHWPSRQDRSRAFTRLACVVPTGPALCRQTVRSSRAEPTFSFAPRLVSSLFDSNGPLLQAPGSFPPSPSLSAVLTFDASAVASLLPVCLGTFDCTRSASAGLSRCSQRRLRKKKLTVSTVRESSLRPSLNFCPSGLGLRPVRS